MSASYRASGVKGDTPNQRPRDLVGDMAAHDQQAKALELELRAEIARLRVENRSLRGELALAWGRAREPLPERAYQVRRPDGTFFWIGSPDAIDAERKRS